jgi:hypothetical protein
MEISLEDVRHALVELGRLRFGEMGVEEAIREIVRRRTRCSLSTARA